MIWIPHSGNLVVNRKGGSMRIVIDPGHGGSDPGCSGYGFLEKDLNLRYAKKLYDLLGNYKDVEVFMTRHTDADVSLQARVAYANSLDDITLFLSCHLNAFNKKARGTETIHSIFAPVNIQGLCKSIGISISNSLGIPFRSTFSKEGDDGDYYYVIRETDASIESMIIEALFLDSEDAINFDADKIAKAICDNLVSFYGLQPKVVDPPPKPVTQSNTWYRIIAGSFSNQEAAITRSEELKAMGIDNWISQFKK